VLKSDLNDLEAYLVCTHEHFASFITACVWQYAFMNDEPIRLAETDEGRAAFESKGNPFGLLKKVMPAIV
jgi:hypothetical protein